MLGEILVENIFAPVTPDDKLMSILFYITTKFASIMHSSQWLFVDTVSPKKGKGT